ncbi:hypothetical protein SAMN05216299_12438 [Nitrosospira sp. Nsp14]|nr:hypothetical protein SAMN05216299_12438 [Nitrosospira sp. Nsp14]
MRTNKYLIGLLILVALGPFSIPKSVSAKEYFTIKNSVLERPTGFRGGFTWAHLSHRMT